MPKKRFIQSIQNPYHITGRCINKEWFPISLEIIWSIFEEYLFFIANAYKIKIHSFVLMNNHFHLIVTSPQPNLSEAMRYLMRETSRQISYESKRINQTWSGRFFRCEITNYHYFMNAYKYVYLNPVVAKLANTAHKYPYSTLSFKLGFIKSLIPLEEDLILFNGDVEKNLCWINSMPSDQDLESIRLALRRRKFSLPKINAIKHYLEKELL